MRKAIAALGHGPDVMSQREKAHFHLLFLAFPNMKQQQQSNATAGCKQRAKCATTLMNGSDGVNLGIMRLYSTKSNSNAGVKGLKSSRVSAVPQLKAHTVVNARTIIIQSYSCHVKKKVVKKKKK